MKTTVVPRKGNHKPYLCEVVDKEEYRGMLTKELNKLELRESLLEISKRQNTITDNYLTHWGKGYYNL